MFSIALHVSHAYRTVGTATELIRHIFVAEFREADAQINSSHYSILKALST